MLINNYLFNDINELNLLVNVDGLPLFKSSSGQVIPILVTIINIPHLKKNCFASWIVLWIRKTK